MRPLKTIIMAAAVCGFLSGCSYFDTKTEADRVLDGPAAARIDLMNRDGVMVGDIPAVSDMEVRYGADSPLVVGSGVEPVSPVSGVIIYPLDEDMRRAFSSRVQ